MTKISASSLNINNPIATKNPPRMKNTFLFFLAITNKKTIPTNNTKGIIVNNKSSETPKSKKKFSMSQPIWFIPKIIKKDKTAEIIAAMLFCCLKTLDNEKFINKNATMKIEDNIISEESI